MTFSVPVGFSIDDEGPDKEIPVVLKTPIFSLEFVPLNWWQPLSKSTFNKIPRRVRTCIFASHTDARRRINWKTW